MSIITLTTDYGTRDYYVGALKGVILGIAPQVQIVDISHEIGPQNIAQAAFVLRQTWPWYPAGTIHVIVVDPGVGSDRRVLLGKYESQYVVAPDNGLITLVHRELRGELLCSVENPEYFLPKVSPTFHGRDIMAPVAAHLANGVAQCEFGAPLEDPVLLPLDTEAEVTDRLIKGLVLYVDGFGNLVTNIRAEQVAGLIEGRGQVEAFVDDVGLGPIRSTFSDVPAGGPVAYLGGGGYVEIGVNLGRAVDRFGSDGVVVLVR